jgi:hypothetical protein
MKTLPTVLVGLLLVVAQSMHASSAERVPFDATYQGTFTIAGPLLTFNGEGPATHLGSSTVVGITLLVPDVVNPLCFNIVQDAVTLTAANGDELHLVNEGQDCLDPVTGKITGTATTTVVGGTGRFEGATGSGTATVEAQVLTPTPDGFTGTFVLRFEGEISAPTPAVD